MKRIMPLIVFVLISCVSYKPVYLDLSMLVIEGQGEGQVLSSIYKDGTVYIETETSGKSIEMRFDGVIPSHMKETLCSGREYVFGSYLRPDGSIEHLKLMDDVGLLAYLGDGLRTNVPGMNLELQPTQSNFEGIKLSSVEGSWHVKMGNPATILIDGVTFTAYLMNIQRGDPQFDQPPFKADLILIRQ